MTKENAKLLPIQLRSPNAGTVVPDAILTHPRHIILLITLAHVGVVARVIADAQIVEPFRGRTGV
jgi:hypothetical protein